MIVLLPGGTLTVAYLNGLAEMLAKAGYRVIGINFRGSDKSTGSSQGVTLKTNADDVAGVIHDCWFPLLPVRCIRLMRAVVPSCLHSTFDCDF
jgi:predicted alpha/beta-fold hydrolase